MYSHVSTTTIQFSMDSVKQNHVMIHNNFSKEPRKRRISSSAKYCGGSKLSLHGFSASKIRATTTIEPKDVKLESNVDTCRNILACPICFLPLIRRGPPGLNMQSISQSGFFCEKCKKRYFSKDVFLDLTITSNSRGYDEFRPLSVETFRSPFVSFVYERGWRQSFERRGFPGPDEEFKMAQKYFEPVLGGLLVDASCGSGLFSRRFVSCGLYSGVIALDYSENMLRQCNSFIKEDKTISTENLALVRADISRLPFATSSIDAIHAGAAIHCWPTLSTAFAEISRVLKPGGMFVATTFILPGLLNSELFRPVRQVLKFLYLQLLPSTRKGLSCNISKKVVSSFIQGKHFLRAPQLQWPCSGGTNIMKPESFSHIGLGQLISFLLSSNV